MIRRVKITFRTPTFDLQDLRRIPVSDFRSSWAIDDYSSRRSWCGLWRAMTSSCPVTSHRQFQPISLDTRPSYDLRNAIHSAVSDDFGRRTYLNMDDVHRARLKVNKVTLKDQGVFRCRVDFVNSPTRSFWVNLTLVEQPTAPVIYDAQGREVTGVGGPFLEGYSLILTCQVSGGKPRPTVTWWKDDELLDGVMDAPSIIGTARKFTINQLFVEKVTKSLWGTRLKCRAQSGSLGKPIEREVPLDIYLKPAAVKIILNEEQIYAGRPIAARCETWGSSPAARILWRLGGVVLRDPNVATTQRTNSTVSKLALVVDKEDDGKELVCRAENPRFPGGVLEEIRILHVAYPPVVVTNLAVGYVLDTLREGDDLKLVCDVQSNPPPTSIVWYHYDTQLEHNVTAGTLVASNTLTLRVLTLRHSGEYSCQAVNAVGATRSPSILIRMKYAPRCREGLQWQEIPAIRHETLSLHCEVEAVPGDTVKFSWTYNNTRGDVLPMPNSRARNQGLSSVLEYTPAADTDFGTLACWASNSVGRQLSPCIFNVIPAKAPQSPLDCSLHNETSALEVNCIPGSDGGLPQHFLLEVRGGSLGQAQTGLLQAPQSDQGVIGEAPPIYQERNPKPVFQLHDLEPGYEYTVAIYAVNNRGRSDPVLLENIRVAAPLGPVERISIMLEDLKKVIPQTSSNNIIVIMALIGAASLILVGIGVVIGLAICRKRSAAPAPEGPDDFTTPTYVPAQRIEPRVGYVSDKRRSQRTSLYIEESRNEPDLLQQVEIDLQS
ncbi:neural cell adhesion molecule 2 isoform X2 [Cephus cinctus]|uniref:Neural cell adhesion molecule 2 isoform X2 n=2 Tax=Cephus cinctus TaxID=211228 RepID=A0AAJ7VWL8_CEPCN|nr:neural cell adhesion molecule 2 isoform X2 [Cephus cinctus]